MKQGKRILAIFCVLSVFIFQSGVPVCSGQEEHKKHQKNYLKDRVILAAERGAGENRPPELDGYGICRMEWLQEAKSGEKILDFYAGYLEKGKDVEQVIRELEHADGIVCAEPDYLCYSLSSQEVSYPFDDAVVEQRWHLRAVRAAEAWKKLEDRGIRPGEGTVVAVVDTGVSLQHPELFDNLWYNAAEAAGEEGVDDDGNGYVDDIYGVNLVNSFTDMTDSCGHGTQMAGIIALGPGAAGSVGISYGSRVMPVKIGTDRNFGTDAAVEGIRYAAANGADVINMSFGTYHDSLLLRTAIQEASEHCMLAAAAGNEGLPIENDYLDQEAGNVYPAAYPEVVGVMALDMQEKIGSYSNWDADPGEGAEYELSAPGSVVYSTLPGGTYDNISGTSPAAAMVSGAMAVYRSMYPDRERNPSAWLQKRFVESQTHTIQHRVSQGVKLHYKRLDLLDLVDFWLGGSIFPPEGSGEPVESAKPESPPVPSETKKPENPPVSMETKEPESPPVPSETEGPESPPVLMETEEPGSPPVSSETKEPENPSFSSGKEKTENPTAPSAKVEPESPLAPSEAVEAEKQFRTSRVILKRSYKKKKRRAKLSWKLPGRKVDQWYIYRSSRKDRGYKLWKKTGRKKITVTCGRKKMYYRVAASGIFDGKTVKSKKSGVKSCIRI